MEGAATTVYAQGGRGNARLVAWEGERTVTFTMEDALISPLGFSILSGAGLIDASSSTPIFQHITETVAISPEDISEGVLTINLTAEAIDRNSTYKGINKAEDYIYVMALDANGEVFTEPFIGTYSKGVDGSHTVKVTGITASTSGRNSNYEATDLDHYFKNVTSVLVDYYTPQTSNAQQIEITPDKFGGTYYLEASTLFRDSATGQDMPAEFIIPKCKIQSNFTFTMASTGDPSTFTFTMDAFPDYTRFDPSKKVLAAIQIMSDNGSGNELIRETTDGGNKHHADHNGIIVEGPSDGYPIEEEDAGV